MRKIHYGLLYTLIVTVLAIGSNFYHTGPKFVSAYQVLWTEEISSDEFVTTLTKGDECSVIIHHKGGDYQDGIAIRTTEKQTWFDVWQEKKPAIQWKFYAQNILGKEKYSFSLWGENYTEETGPEISANCEKYLPELLPSVQKELREYGAME
jgi:hypothetical protein